MKILMVTQKVDLDDDILGFTHGWIEALGDRMDKIFVSAIRVGAHGLTEKAVLLPMDTGWAGRAGRLFNLIKTAGRLILKKEVDLVFVHMSPIFSLLLAPFTAAAGLPQVLWFTHGNVSTVLRAALWAVDRVVTASAEDFPLPSHKVTGTGHGIDCGFFKPAEGAEKTGPGSAVLSVGRISPIKNYELMLDAFGRVAPHYKASMTIAGEEGTGAQKSYFEKIRKMAAGGTLKDRVIFAGKVPHRKILSYYRTCRLLINLSDTNTLDKAVLEAMSCGVPVITSNRAFAPLLRGFSPDLFVEKKDASLVAAAIERVFALSPGERARLGEQLRIRELEKHSLERLMDRLLIIFKDVKRERGI